MGRSCPDVEHVDGARAGPDVAQPVADRGRRDPLGGMCRLERREAVGEMGGERGGVRAAAAVGRAVGVPLAADAMQLGAVEEGAEVYLGHGVTLDLYGVSQQKKMNKVWLLVMVVR